MTGSGLRGTLELNGTCQYPVWAVVILPSLAGSNRVSTLQLRGRGSQEGEESRVEAADSGMRIWEPHIRKEDTLSRWRGARTSTPQVPEGIVAHPSSRGPEGLVRAQSGAAVKQHTVMHREPEGSCVRVNPPPTLVRIGVAKAILRVPGMRLQSGVVRKE